MIANHNALANWVADLAAVIQELALILEEPKPSAALSPDDAEPGHERNLHLQPALLSRKECCRYLGNIAPTTLHSLMNTAGLPSVLIGRRRLFPRDQLDAWIARRTVTASPG